MSEEATAVETKTYDKAITKLGDQLSELTLKQAVDLKDYMKDTYGIEPAAGGAVMVAGAAAGGAGDAEEEEQTEFDVILVSAGDRKIQTIKAVREATSLGLKEAKALVDGIPQAVKEKISKDEADQLKTLLEEAGAAVEIK